jgi:hypothetical protein
VGEGWTGIQSAIRGKPGEVDAPGGIAVIGELTILLSSVRRTAMPASTLPTVSETNMIMVVMCCLWTS